MSDAIREMKRRLRRIRRRRTQLEQQPFEGADVIQHHDVLVIAPGGVHATNELFRFPVVKKEEPIAIGKPAAETAAQGTYVDAPEQLDSYDYSGRRALTIARPQDWGPDALHGRSRGPAFGTLPVKQEPAATACAACYLIDAQNLSFRNAWTAEEWNDIGADDLPAAPSADDPYFEVLVAAPRGKVFHLRVRIGDEKEDFWHLGENTDFQNGYGSIECLDLRYEMEIWNQLRNGCVAGTALRFAGKVPDARAKPIPLVNVTSLISTDREAAQ